MSDEREALEAFKTELRHNAVLSAEYKAHLIGLLLDAYREAFRAGKAEGMRESSGSPAR